MTALPLREVTFDEPVEDIVANVDQLVHLHYPYPEARASSCGAACRRQVALLPPLVVIGVHVHRYLDFVLCTLSLTPLT